MKKLREMGFRVQMAHGAARTADFFLAPASPRPLAALRIGLALILLVQAFMLHGSVRDFLANDGMIQGSLAQALGSTGLPKISWLGNAAAMLHMGRPSDESVVQFACAAYLSALALLGLGLGTRVAAFFAWLLHWMMMNTAESANYGIDIYAHIFLFYLIWVPAGATLSLDACRRAQPGASSAARLGLRLMQLHLCISYFFSAIEKGRGTQWWSGELIWRAMTMPQFKQLDFTWLADWPRLCQALGLGSLALEFFYFIFIWPRRTHRLWLMGVTGMHLGIAVFMGLHLFGLIMCVINLCVFGLSAEPQPEVVAVTAESAVSPVDFLMGADSR